MGHVRPINACYCIVGFFYCITVTKINRLELNAARTEVELRVGPRQW